MGGGVLHDLRRPRPRAYASTASHSRSFSADRCDPARIPWIPKIHSPSALDTLTLSVGGAWTFLELFFWEDLTAQECVDVLGLGLGTVKVHLARAKRALGEALDHRAERGEDEGLLAAAGEQAGHPTGLDHRAGGVGEGVDLVVEAALLAALSPEVVEELVAGDPQEEGAEDRVAEEVRRRGAQRRSSSSGRSGWSSRLSCNVSVVEAGGGRGLSPRCGSREHGRAWRRSVPLQERDHGSKPACERSADPQRGPAVRHVR